MTATSKCCLKCKFILVHRSSNIPGYIYIYIYIYGIILSKSIRSISELTGQKEHKSSRISEYDAVSVFPFTYICAYNFMHKFHRARSKICLERKCTHEKIWKSTPIVIFSRACWIKPCGCVCSRRGIQKVWHHEKSFQYCDCFIMAIFCINWHCLNFEQQSELSTTCHMLGCNYMHSATKDHRGVWKFVIASS